MTNDSLQDRGRAMEDLFFHDLDQKLLNQMKSELSAEEDRTALMAATGIEDREAIHHLVSQGISVETLASVGLIPLVAVAWADGKMEARERQAILKAANESGISSDHSSYQLISNWLTHKPSDSLLQSWKVYVTALKANLDQTSVGQIKRSVIDRAKRVANAAGGFLGVGRTSQVEQEVIEELESVFD